MTPATIIREAQAEGVRLSLSPAGTIKASGRKAALSQWLPVPGEIQALIDNVMALRDCPESDREAFADDWRQDPEGIERGLNHLADFYGSKK